MIAANAPTERQRDQPRLCIDCNDEKQAPIATILSIGRTSNYDHMPICEECGRDLANAIGFMCIREGGWSKIEPRKRKAKR
jgi:hypothetical protein